MPPDTRQRPLTGPVPTVPTPDSASPSTEGKEHIEDRPTCTDQEIDAVQVLKQATKAALDDILEFQYYDGPHPVLGNPIHFFYFLVDGEQSGNCKVRIEAHPSSFRLFYTSPVNIPAPKRALVAEYVCRVNYCLVMGGFEIDMRDGEIQYKIAQHNESGMIWSPSAIASLYVTASAMMAKFWPGFMAVTYGDQSPEAAFESLRVNGSTSPDPEETVPPSGGRGNQSTIQTAPSSWEQ